MDSDKDTVTQVPLRWEHFRHEADIGVRGFGRSPEEAFAAAALALTAVITDPDRVRPREPVPIRAQAPEPDLLLYDWLNSLIYAMATRHMLFSRFDVYIEDGRLEATAWGEPVDPERHQPAVEIKGATFTELKVKRRPDGTWMAQDVVDV
ncbi:MAG TPA: archease [Thiotrichales bacterium]|nr:archease [Thiotrichales bacterium]